MASTTALFTGLTGLNTSSRQLDVIGNNIANVNTTAFKSSRMLFASALNRTVSSGSLPTAGSGGTNGSQIGLGVRIAGTQRDFTAGSLYASGDARDLAIDGNGFFVVRQGDNTLFTRAGGFRANSNNELVTISGERLQGYGVDENFNINTGALVDLTVPIGSMTFAQATQNVRFQGNLNASGGAALQGSQITLSAMTLIGGPIGPDVLQLTSLLTDIDTPSSPGTPQFQVGQQIEIQGAEKGTRALPAATFTITATSTVQDLMNFMTEALGIETSTGANPDGNTPGLALDTTTGVITINGNTGALNELAVNSSDIRLLDSLGALVSQPLTTAAVQAADGESVRTSFVAYDSLGTPLQVDLTLVLDSKTSTGTTWRYYAESADDSDIQTQVGTGFLTFDTDGRIADNSAPASITIDRTGTGSGDPLSVNLVFDSDSGSVSALHSSQSELAAISQDGAPIGTLVGYAVGNNGIVSGAFSNGFTRTIGQVAIATFTNPEGLTDEGSNMFSTGPNSGEPVIGAPLELGGGGIVGGSLELANVDLSQEFINMILATTGYSASSRVITTTNQLFQQLLVIGR